MRIRLEASDRDPFWIVGDPALTPRDEMSQALNEGLQLTRNQQVIAGSEWEGTLHKDRKNQRLTWRATVRWEFATDWERMDFLARLAALSAEEQMHRYQGTVWIRLDRPGTSDPIEFREWELTGAVIGIAATEIDGEVGLRITYTISAGGFSGAVQEGTSEMVTLTGEAGGLTITVDGAAAAALLAGTVDGDTTGFRLGLTVGEEGEGWDLGLSQDIQEVLEEMRDDIPGLYPGITTDLTAGVLTITDASGASDPFVAYLARTGTFGFSVESTITADDETVECQLTGTLNGTTYKLTGLSEEITG